jgi:NADH-quinone oxidoreductase subunit G
VDFLEKYRGDMIDNFSSCKSPQEIMGVLSKTYFAKQENIDPSKIFMVSIMPCTAKKYEITRCEDMFSSGHQDIDVSLTTRELARMIKQAGIDFTHLEEEEADSVLGHYTGAGTIFGATGGVMEAAVRTAYYSVTGSEMADVELKEVRGLKGIKEAELDVAGTKIRIAVAHGLANVEHIVNQVAKAKAEGREVPYHFIEVMACEGGCVGGGGQPYGVTNELRKKRAAGLYSDDRHQPERCSHQNEQVKKIYDGFAGSPNSEVAHKYFHNHYKKRKAYMR